MLGTRLKIKKLLITVNILKYDFPYQTSNNIKTLAFSTLSESLQIVLHKIWYRSWDLSLIWNSALPINWTVIWCRAKECVKYCYEIYICSKDYVTDWTRKYGKRKIVLFSGEMQFHFSGKRFVRKKITCRTLLIFNWRNTIFNFLLCILMENISFLT